MNKRERGRPILYPVTPEQETQIRHYLSAGVKADEIATSQGIHLTAVNRVKRYFLREKQLS